MLLMALTWQYRVLCLELIAPIRSKLEASLKPGSLVWLKGDFATTPKLISLSDKRYAVLFALFEFFGLLNTKN